MPDLATPVFAAGIATNVSCTIATTGSSADCTLTNHAANVLVMITVATKSVIVNATSVTVGGDSARNRVNITDGHTAVTLQLYHIFRSSPGTETVSVTLNGSASFAVTADCFTGTATSPAIGDPITSLRGFGETAPVSSEIQFGIFGPSMWRVYMGIAVAGGNNTISTITPGVNQTEISKAALKDGGITAESNYEDTNQSVTLSATLGASGDGTLYWIAVGAPIFPAPTTELVTTQNDFWTPLTAIGTLVSPNQIVSGIIATVIAGVILYLLFDRKKKTSVVTIGEVQRAGTVVQNIYVSRDNDPESSKRIIEGIPDQLFVGEPRAHREPIQGQHSDDLRGLIKKVTQSALGSDPLTPIVADALEIARTLKKDEESRWLERELYGYEKRPTDQPNTFPDYRRVSAKIPVQLSGITASGEVSENFDIDRTLFVSFSVKRLEDTVNGARSRGAIELVLWMTTPKELSDLAKEQNAQVTSEKTGKTPFLVQINDLERLLSELRLRIHRFATSLATG
jgi:hypothetical protein